MTATKEWGQCWICHTDIPAGSKFYRPGGNLVCSSCNELVMDAEKEGYTVDQTVELLEV